MLTEVSFLKAKKLKQQPKCLLTTFLRKCDMVYLYDGILFNEKKLNSDRC